MPNDHVKRGKKPCDNCVDKAGAISFNYALLCYDCFRAEVMRAVDKIAEDMNRAQRGSLVL